ncbi:type II secretion system F family protein [Oceanobacillus luteolus]|uniref:Type II secretion system F family protein n=1 Tax=Oceanobacillus luteolus TaxID=1274358 RepID=A0ABW4HR13_9BACI|nr:type II secretion system F family protein [Oceanobacillus luteolus]MCM3739537.1 type II secretion system F family protein [Oceanobacillus luteolus]
MIIRILIAVILLVVLTTSLKQKKIYQQFIELYKEDITLPVLAPFAFTVIDKLDVNRRLPRLVNFIHQKMIILKGSKLSGDHTRVYLAKMIITLILLVLLTLVAVEASGGDYEMLVWGSLLTGIVSVFLVKDLDKKVKQRKDSILIDLPEFVNKIILLVNAGETVQGAFEKCVNQNKHRIFESPLYFELSEAVNKMSANTSFQDALKDLSYRSGIQEVSVFTTTVMMNYRKGGAQLTESLKELSVTLWEKRKTITRIKGEEASSKLVFPIIFIFGAVLLIVIYPAIAVF